MTRWLLGVALLALAAAARAQGLPHGVVFDDFDYASTEWEQTISGATPPPTRGPAGSLYGPNDWVVSTSGATAPVRMWYRYEWQESGYVPPERALEPTPTGLRFRVAPGRHQADGCVDAADPSRSLSAQQIASGLTARRGTWVAHVRLGSLPDPERASMMHAFWLLGAYSAWIPADGGQVRVTNEVDHEWNNRFLGRGQAYAFSSTGASLGVGRGARKAPMGTPDAPPELGLTYDREGDGEGERSWSCRYTRDGRAETLGPEACSALLQGRAPDGLPAPDGDAFTTLLIHVGDDGTRFGLVSDGWGGRVEMASRLLSPPTHFPMLTLFSQHLYPGGDGWTCDGRTDLDMAPRFDVDWFLYADDPGLSREAALGLVEQIRGAGVSRLATVADAPLERPDRPLAGWSGRWGYGAWTTPLSLDVRAPDTMAPGSMATVLAFPPRRLGSFRYTWTITARGVDGRTAETVRRDAFALPFQFPRGAASVSIRVRLEELDDDGQVVTNEQVRPIEETVEIERL